ncbi:SsgA family sporulation/cell division regulator [Nocardioides limicola]|uniref:SsgA family sporulation/cell division regulator n=1 Tax=Nocardioides limicola TaxID=2803368 RepID=UPI00193B2DEA|nr:SsgA family sporulation/cell division regulator [Nocardioides sp. DJM-14]
MRESSDSRTQVLARPVVFDCVDDHGRATPLAATFSYDPITPYSVAVTFHTRDTDVRWEFGRDLLAQGLRAPAGEGDVALWPCPSPTGGMVLMVELRSPEGELLAQAPLDAVATFVTDSQELVPLGQESDFLDLDTLVLQLLG